MTNRGDVRRIRVRSQGSWALPAALGATAGLIAGWVLARRPRSVPLAVPSEERSELVAWRARLGDGVEAAVEGLREIRARFLDEPPPDPERLGHLLTAIDGADDVATLHLGDGILELTGVASDEVSRAAAAAVAQMEGVHAVVNRIWTPSSAMPARN